MTHKQTPTDIFLCSSRKLIAVLPLFFSMGAYAEVQDNMVMRGALVSAACDLAPGEESVKLEFLITSDKDLYVNRRTQGMPFKVFLTDCDPTIARAVRITLNGPENPQLPGLLAIDAASEAKGIAIGIETPEGKAVPLNVQGGIRGLSVGRNRIPLKAYIQGEPQALKNRSIKFGKFSAVTTFLLEYE